MTIKHIPMSDSELVAKIREHALRNYNEDGWDYLVECYSDDDIIQIVAGCVSYEAAISRLAKGLKAKDDYRRDIQSEAF
jgi:hypothetical protein